MPAKDSETEVLEVAVELQAKDEAEAERLRTKDAMRDAAFELGVEPGQLERAEAEIARRREVLATKKKKRNRFVLALIGAATAVALGIGIYSAAQPAPPTPWAVKVDSAWVLDVSPGTEARFGRAVEADREVSYVDVDRAMPRADGTWFVNLDGRGLPAFAGHTLLSIELSGTLPHARVYLEAGTDERWRGPQIAVQSGWTKHKLALADFEHQQKVDGKWKVVSSKDPEGITTVSIKLGHYINEPGATGLVRIGEIVVE